MAVTKSGKFGSILANAGKKGKKADPARSNGKPLAKSLDPDFKQFSLLLRKETAWAAIDKVKREGEQDFSELVQSLLEGFINGKRGAK